MTLSYAEAMMKKKQVVIPPSMASSKPPSAHPLKTESSTPSPSMEKKDPMATPSTPSSAWGKNPSATAPAVRDRQNPWKNSTSGPSRSSAASTRNDNSTTKPTTTTIAPVRIQSRHTATPTRTTVANSSTSPKKDPTNVASTPSESIPPRNTTTSPHQQTKNKKKKKPKPQLKSLSIGDMVATKPGKGKATKNGQNQPQPPISTLNETPAVTLELDSTADFPALGAIETKPKPVQTKPSWGISAPSTKTTPTAAGPPPGAQPGKSKGESKKATTKTDVVVVLASPVPDARTAAMFFQPKKLDVPREGDEHQLLRLLEERNVYQKKGRQRLHPRKKKFSALKKKVLQQRLQKWKELNPEEKNDECASCSVCIYNYVQKEELEDEDEYREILENLLDMAIKIGPTKEVFISQELERSSDYPAFVHFESSNHAAAAQACWDGLVVSGSKLRVVLLEEPTATGDWKDNILKVESKTGGLKDISEENVVTLQITDILTEDDYEDEDCMGESLDDLRAVAEKLGDVQKLEPGTAKDGSVYVTFAGKEPVARILESLQNTTIGGKQLSASIVSFPAAPSELEKSMVVLENVLTEDDMEDEDCMEETLGDIRELAERHGTIDTLVVAGTMVKLIFNGSISVAQACATAMNGMTLAGVTVIARVQTDLGEATSDSIYLHNILTDDDLEDEDCLQESLNDIRQLASNHGTVKDVAVVEEDKVTFVKVTYEEGIEAINKALEEFEGKVVGGQIVVATKKPSLTSVDDGVASEAAFLSDTKRKTTSALGDSTESKKARTDDVKPMYSGDKLVPERFAEAKRVPKIPNAPGPRPYAKIVNDENVRPLLTEMLGELMRLQKRAIEEKNTKAKRRLVLGLREVARGIRSHKVKMVVMANNLDEYGAIDEKLQEIIDLAHNEDVPLFFEFTKRGLGKAVGKTIKIAVVGIQNAEGAHQPFKKLVAFASKF